MGKENEMLFSPISSAIELLELKYKLLKRKLVQQITGKS